MQGWNNGWIGVDLDGTLAQYDEWRGPDHIGAPVPLMLERVKAWLAQGKDVRIFTARVSGEDTQQVRKVICSWLKEHLGMELPITNQKDYAMVELWDDRAVQVIPNKGVRVDGQ